MMIGSRPPPRPMAVSTHTRPMTPEPSSPGDDGHLSRSLGAAFGGLTGGMLPLHRQISEVSSITHSGYLFKRSNRPYQQVSPFPPLHSLEIAVDANVDLATEATGVIDGAPALQPKPLSMEDVFSRDSLGDFDTNLNNGDNHQQEQLHFLRRPLHLSPPGALDNPYGSDQILSNFPPMVPLMSTSHEITASISTKATDREDSGELMSQEQAEARRSALEQSLNGAAGFFGMFNLEYASNPPSLHESANDNDIPPASSGVVANGTATPPRSQETKNGVSDVSRLQQQPSRSVPIKVNPKRDSDGSSGPFHHSYYRRSSAPCVYDNHASPGDADTAINSTRSRPSDYLDPNDGHLWRSKYCVLEHGILYFYRNAEDANSQEAKQERQNTGPLADEAMTRGTLDAAADLSKSPMASRNCLIFPGDIDGASNSGGSNSGNSDSAFYYEKRVALNFVGAVRSAETEYGVNAFELLAVADDDDERLTNSLVLKAPKPEDMSEWLFQFHRSLASFIRDMVDFVGSSYALGDIHHPGFQQAGVIGQVAQSPLRSYNVPAFSPRILNYSNHGPSVPASLSHGHGRSQLRRRRADLASKGLSSSQSVHSVPTTPMSQSPTSQLQFPLSNIGSLNSKLATVASDASLVTPLKHGDDLCLPEPEVQRTDKQQIELDRPPELSAPQSANPPETERPPAPATGGKYVPPHLRKGKYLPPHLRKKTPDAEGTEGSKPPPRKYVPPQRRNPPSGNESSILPAEKERVENSFASSGQIGHVMGIEATMKDGKTVDGPSDESHKLGGCADPQVISGSIMDNIYVPRKASRVGPAQTNAYGSFGGAKASDAKDNDEADTAPASLSWEIGAVSECGIRESNEDAYLVTNDLLETFNNMHSGSLPPTYWDGANDHQSGLFAIFDGHGGNQAARYAAEKLPHFLFDESVEHDTSAGVDPDLTAEIMRRAIQKLDEEFCRLCVEGEREWESGSTALIAMLANEHLVIANIGDCRGVLIRLVEDGRKQHALLSEQDAWNELDREHGDLPAQRCFWREVADLHSPSRKDEKERIERAGGWTTTEKEIPISQLQRMDFCDEDVIQILKRCFQDRYNNSSKACSSAPQRILQISRVCGELAVSRAIGDRDFKAACHAPSSDGVNEDRWENSSLFLSYPDNHSRHFVGDLVSGKPDFQAIRVGEAGIQGEFLLLACDGLWDVIDMDDAVRITRDLLFEKGRPAKEAAARLAELAIHLGSSDNVTVIVVKFTAKDPTIGDS